MDELVYLFQCSHLVLPSQGAGLDFLNVTLGAWSGESKVSAKLKSISLILIDGSKVRHL